MARHAALFALAFAALAAAGACALPPHDARSAAGAAPPDAAARLGGRTLRDFERYASPEERERMQRARERGEPSTQPLIPR